jgi:hypothetical protein
LRNIIVSSIACCRVLAVLARRANGWIQWKDKNGNILDDLKRK